MTTELNSSKLIKTHLFLSYARMDDNGLAEVSLVRRLHADLTAQGFTVWWDREYMPNRGLTFLNEIRDAISGVDCLLLVVGPGAMQSEYVRAEWEYALSICKPVLPILLKGDYSLLPDELKHIDTPDFREPADYESRLLYLLRQLQTSTAQLGKLIGVPSLPRFFQPRPSDTMSIKASLLADTKQPVVVTAPARRAGLHGMGGIGKTVLATAIARDCEVRRVFFEGVLWVTLGQTANVTARQVDLCRALGDSQQTFTDVQQGKARLSDLLTDKVCLVILDDVWELEHILAFDALGQRSSLLVTARDARLITSLRAVEHPLGVMSEDEALMLIARWLLPLQGMSSSDELEYIRQAKALLPIEASLVAKECGYLPLALVLSAVQVHDGTSWNDLLEALREADLDFLEHPQGSIMKSLKVSIDALERENASYAAFYRELAIFPEDAVIPEDAVLTLWQRNGDLSARNARQLLTTLGRKALIQLEGKSSTRRMRLHDLLYDYLRNELRDVKALHDMLLDAYSKKCSGGWHTGPNDGYFFEYLTYHLHEARRKDELHTLLTGSPQWMETKFAAHAEDASYAADIELAIQDIPSVLPAQELLSAIPLYTAQQVVFARVSTYDDMQLQTLVWLGRKEEAIRHAYLRRNADEVFYGLMAVNKSSYEKSGPDIVILDKAYLVACTIQDPFKRLIALGDLAAAYAPFASERADKIFAEMRKEEGIPESRSFPESVRQGGYVQGLHAVALAKAKRFEEASKDLHIAGTAADEYISAAKGQVEHIRNSTTTFELAKSGCFDEIETWKSYPSSRWKVTLLSTLAVALAKKGDSRASQIFTFAEKAAYAVENQSERVLSLSELAVALIKVKDPHAADIFIQAEKMARAIEDANERAEALSGLALSRAKVGDSRVTALLVEVGQATGVAKNTKERVIALSMLAGVLARAGDSRASVIFTEAEQAINAIQCDSERAISLCELTVMLAKVGDERAPTIFARAEQTMRGIQDSTRQAFASSELAATLVRVGHTEQATAMLWESINKAGGLLAYFSQVHMPIILAIMLAQTQQLDGILWEVAARTIASPSKYITEADMKIHGELAAVLARAGQPSRAIAAFRNAQKAKSSIKIPSWGFPWHLNYLEAVLLLELVHGLAVTGYPDQAAVVFMEEHQKNSPGYYQNKFIGDDCKVAKLSVTAMTLAQAGKVVESNDLLSEAIEATQHNRNNWGQHTLVLALGKADRIAEASSIARTIRDDKKRSEVTQALATMLASTGRFVEAFRVLESSKLDEFLHILIRWSFAFEEIEQGLSIDILYEAIRVVSWVYPDWKKVYESLSTKDECNR